MGKKIIKKCISKIIEDGKLYTVEKLYDVCGEIEQRNVTYIDDDGIEKSYLLSLHITGFNGNKYVHTNDLNGYPHSTSCDEFNDKGLIVKNNVITYSIGFVGSYEIINSYDENDKLIKSICISHNEKKSDPEIVSINYIENLDDRINETLLVFNKNSVYFDSGYHDLGPVYYDSKNDYDINEYIDHGKCSIKKSIKYLNDDGNIIKSNNKIGCKNETEVVYEYNENGDVTSIITRYCRLNEERIETLEYVYEEEGYVI